MSHTILLVDDDHKILTLLREYLERSSFTVHTVASGDEALREFQRLSPDVIILDIMLPGKDGFEVCREIRRQSRIPIIMLTARGEVTDRIVGLEIGADDYLPKPFDPRELVARINAVLRRHRSKDERKRLTFGNLVIDAHSYEAYLNGEPLSLTTMEFQILSVLARNPGMVLDRDTIFARIKGMDDESFDRSIDVAVSRLRAKLGDDPKSPRYIRTVRGTGYKFIATEGA
jgi:DNA-binding response OmpR family regulator